MRMTKKVVSIVLAVMMVAAMMSVMAVSASAATISVSTAAELDQAVAAASSGDTIKLTADIDYSTIYTVRNARDDSNGNTEHRIDLKDCTLDLSGHTISTINATVVFGGNGATIKNGTFALVPKDTNGSYKAGSYALIIDSKCMGYANTATVNVENVVCNGAVNICGTTTELTNVTASTTATKFYAIWAEQDARVTVNSGTFTDNQSGGKGVIATGTGEEGGAAITVNGGSFEGVNKLVYNTEANAISINGGSFEGTTVESQVSTYADAGKNVEVVDGKTYIGYNVITTAEELAAACENGGNYIVNGTIATDATYTIAAGKTLSLVATSGSSVTTTAEQLFVNNGTFTLDGGSYVAVSGVVDNKAGTAAIKGGAVLSNTSNDQYDYLPVLYVEGGTVNLADATVISTSCHAVGCENDAVLNINNSSAKVQAKWYGLYAAGNAVCNFSAGSVTSDQEQNFSSISPVYAVYTQENGTINMSGTASISGFRGGLILNGGNVNISGGTIDATGANAYRAIHVTPYGGYDSNVDITGGTFSAPNEVIMLNNTNADNKCNVSIEGGTFTSTKNKDTIKLGGTNPYEFEISGGTFSKDVPVQYLANTVETELVDENYVVVAAAEPYVARIVSQRYTALQDAIDAATSGATIVLVGDVTLTSEVVIPNGLTLTLDLNGHDISGNVDAKMIQNHGNLTINDTTSAPGHIYNTNMNKQCNAAVVNYEDGVATINNGYYGDSDSDMTNANNINRGAGFQNYGTATVNGGYFTALDNFVNGGWAYAIINYGAIVINDATVYGHNNGNLCNNTGSMTVNGGNYTLTKGTEQNYYSIYNNDTSATTVVNDGTFTNTTGTALTWSPAGSNVIELNGGDYTYTKFVQSGSPVVSGGTFSKDVDVYAADGFVGTKNANGTYGVKVDTNPLNGVAEIEGYQNKIAGSASTSDDGNDINTKGVRILTKVDKNKLEELGITEYGYVVAKVSGKAQASAKFDLLTADKSGGNGQKVINCTGTYNNGINGVDNTYVTLAVNGMNDGDQVAVRFYAVDEDGTYYSYYVGSARYNGIIATMH